MMGILFGWKCPKKPWQEGPGCRKAKKEEIEADWLIMSRLVGRRWRPSTQKGNGSLPFGKWIFPKASWWIWLARGNLTMLSNLCCKNIGSYYLFMVYYNCINYIFIYLKIFIIWWLKNWIIFTRVPLQLFLTLYCYKNCQLEKF